MFRFETLQPLDWWCCLRPSFRANPASESSTWDFQEDNTLSESLVAYYSTSPDEPKPWCLLSDLHQLLFHPQPSISRAPTCLLSPSFFQGHAVSLPEVLEEPSARDPGPSPSTLHHLDPGMHLEGGELYQLFPEDGDLSPGLNPWFQTWIPQRTLM